MTFKHTKFTVIRHLNDLFIYLFKTLYDKKLIEIKTKKMPMYLGSNQLIRPICILDYVIFIHYLFLVFYLQIFLSKQVKKMKLFCLKIYIFKVNLSFYLKHINLFDLSFRTTINFCFVFKYLNDHVFPVNIEFFFSWQP